MTRDASPWNRGEREGARQEGVPASIHVESDCFAMQVGRAEYRLRTRTLETGAERGRGEMCLFSGWSSRFTMLAHDIYHRLPLFRVAGGCVAQPNATLCWFNRSSLLVQSPCIQFYSCRWLGIICLFIVVHHVENTGRTAPVFIFIESSIKSIIKGIK